MRGAWGAAEGRGSLSNCACFRANRRSTFPRFGFVDDVGPQGSQLRRGQFGIQHNEIALVRPVEHTAPFVNARIQVRFAVNGSVLRAVRGEALLDAFEKIARPSGLARPRTIRRQIELRADGIVVRYVNLVVYANDGLAVRVYFFQDVLHRRYLVIYAIV